MPKGMQEFKNLNDKYLRIIEDRMAAEKKAILLAVKDENKRFKVRLKKVSKKKKGKLDLPKGVRYKPKKIETSLLLA
jgi:hypothetical protein